MPSATALWPDAIVSTPIAIEREPGAFEFVPIAMAFVPVADAPADTELIATYFADPVAGAAIWAGIV